jgi:hypothetical protein
VPRAKEAQSFYGEVIAWTVEPFSTGDSAYDMIHVGDAMIGGYEPDHEQPAHWISYLSVDDVDVIAAAAIAHGGKVIVPPRDLGEIGRMARVVDPQGAQLCLFKNAMGDPPDTAPRPGEWLWNELHTTDPRRALEFYEGALGFSHRSVDMGPGGTYHVLSKGGVDRGGVTGHLTQGVRPHWLPYVFVVDVDGTVDRARRLGAGIHVGPDDIPGIGRFAVIEDPFKALVAVMKPTPMEVKK